MSLNPGMMSSTTPEWGTPQALFDELEAQYGPFTLDPCATHQNTKVPQNYFVEAEDGLSRKWTGRVFMNPPYGRRINRWVRKAYEEVAHGNATLVVCLLPARTDTAWWHDYCMRGDVTFIRGRVYFEQAGKSGCAPFPSAVVVFDSRVSAMTTEVLARAEKAEAEAARLRCCGNCEHRDEEVRDYYGSYFVCLTEFKPGTNLRHSEVDCEDQCHFTPSRWKEAER